MFNGLNPINSLFTDGAPSGSSSLFDPSPASFGSTFDQAMTQAQTPADKAKVLFTEAKFAEQSALASMFSDSFSSLMGLGASGIFGTGTGTGLPSWVYDAQRVLGNNPQISNLISMSQQANYLLQSRLNQQLSSMGISGSAFDSIF